MGRDRATDDCAHIDRASDSEPESDSFRFPVPGSDPAADFFPDLHPNDSGTDLFVPADACSHRCSYGLSFI
jgi:hypothetical protein